MTGTCFLLSNHTYNFITGTRLDNTGLDGMKKKISAISGDMMNNTFTYCFQHQNVEDFLD